MESPAIDTWHALNSIRVSSPGPHSETSKSWDIIIQTLYVTPVVFSLQLESYSSHYSVAWRWASGIHGTQSEGEEDSKKVKIIVRIEPFWSMEKGIVTMWKEAKMQRTWCILKVEDMNCLGSAETKLVTLKREDIYGKLWLKIIIFGIWLWVHTLKPLFPSIKK